MAKSDVLVRMKADTQNYDANIAKARRQLEGFKKDNLSLGGVMKQTSASLVSMAARFASVTAAIGAATSAFTSNIETARKFELSMSQLSSLTGMVGDDLAKLKDYAIELGSSTTLSASQVADAFKLIGSQQPQLLESGEALKEVTKYAIMLSEAAGIELATAAQTLSTSINQMGGDSDNAARFVNVLAAASQKGAGDIAWLGEAVTKSGTTARAVGTSYEELVANLEQLAKAGFDASTAGTALRSIIMNLEAKASNEFKPSVVGLTTAFENLGKANLTVVEYQKLTGKMFASQAMALAQAAGEARNMTKAITGTNTAEEQAKTNTNNLDGALKGLASAWEGLNLHINSSNGLLRDAVDWLKDVVVWADKAITSMGNATGDRDRLNNEGGGGQTRVDRQVSILGGVSVEKRKAIYDQQVTKYWRYINEWNKKLKEAESRKDVFAWETIQKNNDISQARSNIAGATSMLNEYKQRAEKLLASGSSNISEDTKTGGTSGGDGGKTPKVKTQIIKTEEQLNTESIQKLTQEYIYASRERQQAIREEIKVLQERNEEIQQMKDEALGKSMPPIVGMRGIEQSPIGITNQNPFEQYKTGLPQIITPLQQLEQELKNIQALQAAAWTPEVFAAYQQRLLEIKSKIDAFKGIKKDADSSEKSFQAAASAIGQVGSALQNIQDPSAKIMGTIGQAIAQIALGFATATTTAATAGPFAWIAAIAGGMATMISTIEAIHSATGFAKGGVIDGTRYSGDTQLVRANAGELILNKSSQNNLAASIMSAESIIKTIRGYQQSMFTLSQQGSLASQLEGGGLENLRLSATISGEQIRLALNNNSRRSGRGEYVTTNFR